MHGHREGHGQALPSTCGGRNLRETPLEKVNMKRAKPYERNGERTDYRNGKRKRKLTTRVGEIELEVPRMRILQFQTEVIERYRRMEISLEEAMIEMYLSGISTRRISDVTEALCDTTLRGFTGSYASDIVRLDSEIVPKVFRTRGKK